MEKAVMRGEGMGQTFKLNLSLLAAGLWPTAPSRQPTFRKQTGPGLGPLARSAARQKAAVAAGRRIACCALLLGGRTQARFSMGAFGDVVGVEEGMVFQHFVEEPFQQRVPVPIPPHKRLAAHRQTVAGSFRTGRLGGWPALGFHFVTVFL